MNLPIYIYLIFILTTGLTYFLFIKATDYSKTISFAVAGWLFFQGILGYLEFYTYVGTEPYRFLLAAPPTLLIILGVFVSKRGRNWILSLDLKTLTILHSVRIPVELVLYWLFLHKTIPELMTFSGRNFDILAGITAPFVYYFGFVKNKIGRKGILLWNIICLILLLNIVINAILSVPAPFQQFAFNQPNIAILYFPMVWLLAFVVPVVLFSHLVAIKRLYD